MGLLKRIIKPRNLFPDADYVIEKAFTVGGVDYFRFADIFNLPYERGLQAVAVYNELDMRCTRKYLMAHTEALGNLLRANPIDVFAINTLNEQMKQRLGLPIETDILYRLAAVAFFDENENPAVYDQEYSDRKIAHWKKHKGVHDFFLQQSVVELIPFLQSPPGDLNTFSELIDELNDLHLERLRTFTSRKE